MNAIKKALADMEECILHAQSFASRGYYALAASELYEAGDHARAAMDAKRAARAEQVPAQ